MTQDEQKRTCISCWWVRRDGDGTLFCTEPAQSRTDAVTGDGVHAPCEVLRTKRSIDWLMFCMVHRLKFGPSCGRSGQYWQKRDGAQ